MRLSGAAYGQLVADLLVEGQPVLTAVGGASMRPFIPDGAVVRLVPLAPEHPRVGEVVVRRSGAEGRLLCHRLARQSGVRIQTWGDACAEPDDWGEAGETIGRVEAIQEGERWRPVVVRSPLRMRWRYVKRHLRRWLGLDGQPNPSPCEPDTGGS